MFCFSEKILGIMSSLFMIFYGISFLCNDFRCVEPCFLFLGSIGIASFFSEFLAYVILFVFKGKR